MADQTVSEKPITFSCSGDNGPIMSDLGGRSGAGFDVKNDELNVYNAG